jgi:hypothetical protein
MLYPGCNWKLTSAGAFLLPPPSRARVIARRAATERVVYRLVGYDVQEWDANHLTVCRAWWNGADKAFDETIIIGEGDAEVRNCPQSSN